MTIIELRRLTRRFPRNMVVGVSLQDDANAPQEHLVHDVVNLTAGTTHNGGACAVLRFKTGMLE